MEGRGVRHIVESTTFYRPLVSPPPCPAAEVDSRNDNVISGIFNYPKDINTQQHFIAQFNIPEDDPIRELFREFSPANVFLTTYQQVAIALLPADREGFNFSHATFVAPIVENNFVGEVKVYPMHFGQFRLAYSAYLGVAVSVLAVSASFQVRQS